jgi:hypothetical protein
LAIASALAGVDHFRCDGGTRDGLERVSPVCPVGKQRFIPKRLSLLNWLDDFLYLPEVLYVLFFIWLLCSGPGKFSVDYWLAS